MMILIYSSLTTGAFLVCRSVYQNSVAFFLFRRDFRLLVAGKDGEPYPHPVIWHARDVTPLVITVIFVFFFPSFYSLQLANFMAPFNYIL